MWNTWSTQSDFPSNWGNMMGYYGNQPYGNANSFLTGGVVGVMAGVYMMVIFLAIVAIYVLAAMSLTKIARKTKTKTPIWFAWVPILNSILILNIAGFSGWYLLLILVLACIPVIGWGALFLFLVYIWMKISVACKKPDYLGLLVIMPPMILVLMLYFAYGDELKLK